MGKNTAILHEVTVVLFTDLDAQANALNRLKHHFHDRLLVDVGNVSTVAAYAEQLRLRITEEGAGRVPVLLFRYQGIPASNSSHEQSSAVFSPQSTASDGFVPLPASSSCK